MVDHSVLFLLLLFLPVRAAWPGQSSYGQILLGPDDNPACPPAPVGFDKLREGIQRGKVETIEYYSKTVGVARRALVYTPPGFSPLESYPVLYLLHGVGGTETEWLDNACTNVILDNLLADRKIVPMIVVFPNGRAALNDRPEGNLYAHAAAFERFGTDLLEDVVPTIESRYPAKKGSIHRALAGSSMGGGQALNIGLGNLDLFAWIGGFSAAPNTRSANTLVPTCADAKAKLKLLWLSCGDQDAFIAIGQNLCVHLKQKGVSHVWHVDSGIHAWSVWKNDLYLFAQKIFRSCV